MKAGYKQHYTYRIRKAVTPFEGRNVYIHFILQDILDVKKNLTRINGLISVIATLIMFSSFEIAVIGNNLWVVLSLSSLKLFVKLWYLQQAYLALCTVYTITAPSPN